MNKKCKQCKGVGYVDISSGMTLQQGRYLCGICKGTGIQPIRTPLDKISAADAYP